jgi:hypothetical protein
LTLEPGSGVAVKVIVAQVRQGRLACVHTKMPRSIAHPYPHPTHRLRTLPPIAAAVLSLVAALLLGAAAPAVALSKPVINGPVFNDPLGTPAQQKAIFTQLVQLIDATPPGATIRGSMYEFYDQEVADALLAAHRRLVDVRLIVDDSTFVTREGVEWTNEPYETLKDGLGTNDAARSWIVVCDDKFEDPDGVDDVRRGCLSVAPPQPAYSHNKFFVFSMVGPFADRTSYSKVVFQTSSNLSDWYKVVSYNDAVTFRDSTVYDGFVSYHEKLRKGRTRAAGNNQAYFSPRPVRPTGASSSPAVTPRTTTRPPPPSSARSTRSDAPTPARTDSPTRATSAS